MTNRFNKKMFWGLLFSLSVMVAVIEFVVIWRYGVIKSFLVYHGYCEYTPEERKDYLCIKAWTNTLEKLNYKADICFFGNSLTYNSDFQSDYPSLNIVNLGYSGDRIEGMMIRKMQIFLLHPRKIFLMVGVNDLAQDYVSVDTFTIRLETLVHCIIEENPHAELFLESILPINQDLKPYNISAEKIISANDSIREIARRNSLKYIDLFHLYSDKEGSLPNKYTEDGLHLKKEAYSIWSKAISKYIE